MTNPYHDHRDDLPRSTAQTIAVLSAMCVVIALMWLVVLGCAALGFLLIQAIWL